MQEYTFQMLDSDEVNIFVYRWTPEDEVPVKGIVQIAHGMSETAKRYEELADCLTKHGFIIYANDHRGHGKTAIDQGMLGDGGPDAFKWMTKDMGELGELIQKEHPGLPVFLLGHSMGSFLTQKLMYEGPHIYEGYILSGTNGKRGLLGFGQRIALLQSVMQGQEHRSLLLNAVVFGGFNRSFRPAVTPFDWLSNDVHEVKKFIDDPLCGSLCTARFYRGFFELLMEIHLPHHLANIPKDKPVYIFSGGKDPVGMNGKGVLNLVEMYKNLEIKDLEYRIYPEGRHEMLHEINRKEVEEHVADWLLRHMPTSE
ncbi:alpha/beta hydrolase [Paenibacillus sp. Marseille-Q4541]|uniref:alpha/beta fold hydrolase n=1 Tax=Paenibacillus sp. Marseille-Q4541 TaxID=2831522 RepID=UPI001BA8B3D0|nr:alpha/beta hydrolase [Paenibacillus sp. Marseille-Q4541]